jgi:hypothetical protein
VALIAETVLPSSVSDPVLNGYSLSQNDPNPFHGSTRISLALGRAGHTIVEIFDESGRAIATLIDRSMPQGTHLVVWDASDVPPGVYFCRVRSGDWSATASMIVR